MDLSFAMNISEYPVPLSVICKRVRLLLHISQKLKSICSSSLNASLKWVSDTFLDDVARPLLVQISHAVSAFSIAASSDSWITPASANISLISCAGA